MGNRKEGKVMTLMEETILVGRDRQISEMPRAIWQEHLAQAPQHIETRLGFMSEAHHNVRYFVVKELPNQGRPIEPELISQALQLPLGRVKTILDELEQNLFFLVRNERGAVLWAYPVTAESTPHHITFSTQERLYGAWAEDAIATPFVQGRLRNEQLAVTIETACGHCGQAMRITVDSDMQVSVDGESANPLVFTPHVDWETFTEPTIIDAYWRNSLFFWSEEHAREYRAETDQVDGIYLTLEQAAYETPITQGALFAFE